MSFKIRPNHERIFNSVRVEQPQDLVEENVLMVDEETGEIVEGTQMVPREQSTNPTHPSNPANNQTPAPKDNKFIGLAMRKKSKVSFM